MTEFIRDRIIACADYYIDNKSTIRKTAKIFNISKSTVHINLSRDLQYIDKSRYNKVRKISIRNKKMFEKCLKKKK